MTDKVTFASGATSGELKPRYFLMTGFGAKVTALRFGYGNTKHEDGETVLANANWLKGFHDRDLAFFQDRAAHAKEHLEKEMSGRFDDGPGGNWGAVGWIVDIMPFVKEYDPDFYLAIVGLKPHPGKREQECGCPRCMGGVTGKAKPPFKHIGTSTNMFGKVRRYLLCEACKTGYYEGDRHACKCRPNMLCPHCGSGTECKCL